MERMNSYAAILVMICLAAVNNTICSAAENETIIDNLDAGASWTGTWKISRGTNPYGSNSVYSSNAGSTFTFSSDLSYGEYKVYMWWTSTTNRSDDIPVTVSSDAGQAASYTISQKTGSGQWNLLDTVILGTNTRLTITSSGDGSTSADAVKFVTTTVA